MNKIERLTDKRLKEQIKDCIFYFWEFIIIDLALMVLYLFKGGIDTLVASGIFLMLAFFMIMLAFFMKVLEILDKIRLEIRGV